MENSGSWHNLSNGDRVWLLKIQCTDAKSINLNYRKFYLPEGSKLHVYNPDFSTCLGAFTHLNNLGIEDNPTKFATGLVGGDVIIVQLYESKKSLKKPVIQISEVIYGFKCSPILKSTEHDINCFGGSGNCHVNINCSEGNDWQAEKTGVAMVATKNGRCWLTGSLLNNTAHDATPYFLTAEHGLHGSGGNLSVGDTAQWLFHWNWESVDCNDGGNFDPPSTYGAVLVASYPSTDMALLRLCETPQSVGLDTYYNGWDRTNNTISRGAMLHHPAGDIKKIATYSVTPQTSGNRWYISSFDATSNGYSIPQGGSSGAPIFNSNHHVIGNHWSSARDNCQNPANEFSNSGKISVSWNTSPNASGRLKDWLDPHNSSVNSLNGEWYYGCESSLIVQYGSTLNFDDTKTINCDGCAKLTIYVAGELNISNKQLNLLNESSIYISATGVVNINSGSLCMNNNSNIKIENGGRIYINGVNYNQKLTDHYNLTLGNSTISGNYYASNNIEISRNIQTNGVTNIVAGRSIVFKDGFIGKPDLYAYIDKNINNCEEEIPCFAKNLRKSNKEKTETIVNNNNDTEDQNKTFLNDKKEALLDVKRENISQKFDFVVYPNPNKSNFSIDIKTNEPINYSFEILNSKGIPVYRINQLKETKVNISKSSLKFGVYFIRINNGDSIITKKMIVQ